MTYHVDRFHAAVTILAGDGHVKQRLMKAYEENLDSISEEDLPGDMQPQFSELKNQMTSVEPMNGEGPICASVRKMSAQEASECAVSVVSLYGEILQILRGEDVSIDVDQLDEKVPPFLVKSAS